MNTPLYHIAGFSYVPEVETRREIQHLYSYGSMRPEAVQTQIEQTVTHRFRHDGYEFEIDFDFGHDEVLTLEEFRAWAILVKKHCSIYFLKRLVNISEQYMIAISEENADIILSTELLTR